MKQRYITTFFICLPFLTLAQTNNAAIISTSDIDRFWIAFDSVKAVKDTTKQIELIQRLYIDRSTPGLKAFMKVRKYNAAIAVRVINKYPNFWASIRPNTLQVKKHAKAFVKSIKRLKALYPEMKPSDMYFIIGGLSTGGTTMKNMILVGTEIETADKNTQASELSPWLQNMFKAQNGANLVGVNMHEYIHTQQKQGGNTVLAKCLMEGSADYLAAIVTGRKNNNPYMIYGRKHEAELKVRFATDMYGNTYDNWLYNGLQTPHADLGYFMGYEICKAYYQKTADKKKAIKNIIEIDYNNDHQVKDFLKQSGYY